MAAFEGLPYLDFSLDILRRLPSKKVNWKQYPENELAKYRNTTEETNALINGFEIARGLAALGMVSHGKTHKEILKLLNYACFGKKSASKSLEECLEEIEKLKKRRETVSNNYQVIRMFFEQRDVTPFDRELIKKLDDTFVQLHSRTDHTKNDHVLHECNFASDPSGRVTKAKIDAEIYRATDKVIKKVIRTDLLPDWRARFLMAHATDESFRIRNINQPESLTGYFYNDEDDQSNNKSWCSYVRARIFARVYERSYDYIVYEISTTNENESLIILLPKNRNSLKKLLSSLTAQRIAEMVHQCNGNFEEREAIIPKMAIPGSFGLRSILNTKNSLFSKLIPYFSDPFAISRMFCPYKAEFTKIIGKKKMEAWMIFPLYELYCKFRCNIKFQTDALTPPRPPSETSVAPAVSIIDNNLVNPEQQHDVQKYIILATKSETEKINGLVERASRDQSNALPKNDNKKADTAGKPSSTKSAPVGPAGATPPNPVSTTTPAPVRALHICCGGPEIKELPKKNFDDGIYSPPRYAPIAKTFQHAVTIEDERSGSFEHNAERHPRNRDMGENDTQFDLNAEITLTHPFLFMIVSRFTVGQNNNGQPQRQVLFPKFIGRFTNVEETFDESWTKK